MFKPFEIMKYRNGKHLKSVITVVLFTILQILSRKRNQAHGASSVAGQETLIGITGRNFIILGADSSRSSSLSLTSNDVDKINIIIDPSNTSNSIIYENTSKQDATYGRTRNNNNSNNIINEQPIIAVASAGDSADSERLLGHLIAHASSMEYQYSLGSDVKCLQGNISYDNNFGHGGVDAEAIAHLARGIIANSLRSREQFKTCLLIAGMVRCRYQYQNQKEKHNQKNDYSFANNIQTQIQLATGQYHTTTTQNEDDYSTNNNNNNDDDNDHKRKYEEDMVEQAIPPPTSFSPNDVFLRPTLFWLDEYGSLQNVQYASHGLASNFVLSILDRKYKSDLSKEEAIDLIMDCFNQLRSRFVINNPKPPCIKCIDENGCCTVVH